MNETEQRNRHAVARSAAAGLIAAGALIVALCGTCTAFFAGPAAWSIVTHKAEYLAGAVVMFAAVIGGIPTLIGVLMLVTGLKRRRAATPPPATPPPGDAS